MRKNRNHNVCREKKQPRDKAAIFPLHPTSVAIIIALGIIALGVRESEVMMGSYGLSQSQTFMR